MYAIAARERILIICFPLPVDEWLKDAHSQSARNLRFLSIYAGTDTKGNKSPDTRYVYERDYGKVPLPPAEGKSYFGPGYKLDFPSSQGNCACCHTPIPAVEAPYEVDPRRVSDIAAEGISCDFCHKIVDVRLDPHTTRREFFRTFIEDLPMDSSSLRARMMTWPPVRTLTCHCSEKAPFVPAVILGSFGIPSSTILTGNGSPVHTTIRTMVGRARTVTCHQEE
jgi:hypothetical protein